MKFLKSHFVKAVDVILGLAICVLFFVFAKSAFAQFPTPNPSAPEGAEWYAAFQSLLKMQSLAPLGVAILIVQLSILAVRKYVNDPEGKIKICILYLGSLAVGILGQMAAGVLPLQAITSSVTLTFAMNGISEIIKTLGKKKSE